MTNMEKHQKIVHEFVGIDVHLHNGVSSDVAY